MIYKISFLFNSFITNNIFYASLVALWLVLQFLINSSMYGQPVQSQSECVIKLYVEL